MIKIIDKLQNKEFEIPCIHEARKMRLQKIYTHYNDLIHKLKVVIVYNNNECFANLCENETIIDVVKINSDIHLLKRSEYSVLNFPIYDMLIYFSDKIAEYIEHNIEFINMGDI